MDKYQLKYKIDELNKQRNDLIQNEINNKVKEFSIILNDQKDKLDAEGFSRILQGFALDIKYTTLDMSL